MQRIGLKHDSNSLGAGGRSKSPRPDQWIPFATSTEEAVVVPDFFPDFSLAVLPDMSARKHSRSPCLPPARCMASGDSPVGLSITPEL
jgi:hypothetical protein